MRGLEAEYSRGFLPPKIPTFSRVLPIIKAELKRVAIVVMKKRSKVVEEKGVLSKMEKSPRIQKKKKKKKPGEFTSVYLIA